MPSVPYFAHQNDEIFQVGAHGGAEDLKVIVSDDPRPQQHPLVTRTVWNGSGHVHAYNPDATHVHNFRRALETVLGLPTFTTILRSGIPLKPKVCRNCTQIYEKRKIPKEK
eukprot:12257813-Ditylum_brightwellii.AAC.1